MQGCFTIVQETTAQVLALRDQKRAEEETRAARQERIFGRFERATSASQVSGLGLGLFLCLQIVAQHGGRIWVESDQGRGSTFSFELPLRQAAG